MIYTQALQQYSIQCCRRNLVEPYVPIHKLQESKMKKNQCVAQCEELPSYKYRKPEIYTVIKSFQIIFQRRNRKRVMEKRGVRTLRLYNVYPLAHLKSFYIVNVIIFTWMKIHRLLRITEEKFPSDMPATQLLSLKGNHCYQFLVPPCRDNLMFHLFT